MPTTAICPPTDKSMPPPIITADTPTTTIPNMDTWRKIFMTLFGDRKFGAKIAKKTKTTARKI
jgi:hypothetical protein